MSNKVLAALALVLVGCGASPSTRTITGQLGLSAYAVDNPVVIAQSAGRRAFVTSVAPSGRFMIVVPANDSYRLTLANSTRAGTYVAISRVSWPTGGRWAQVGPGATLTLGSIHPVAANSAGLGTLDHGSDDGASDGGSGESESGEAEPATIDQCHPAGGQADLPYDVKPQLGQTFQLSDAFALKGPLPAAIVSVDLDGTTWRAAELTANTPFVITQADCTHAGNRDTGRDRVFITWRNADGSTETDHLDIRYCDGGGGTSSATASGSSSVADDGCEDDGVTMCDDAAENESRCDGSASGLDDDSDEAEHEQEHQAGTCGGATPTTGGGDSGAGGAPCTINADCAAGLACFSSVCSPPLL